MSETGRNIKLILGRGREQDPGPLSEGWRTSANVHGNIQGLSFDDAAELGLSTMQLIMEAAQSSFYRTGVIVLYEYVSDSSRGEPRLVISFAKETAGVAEDVGAKLPHFGKRCRDLLQAIGLASPRKHAEIKYDSIRIPDSRDLRSVRAELRRRTRLVRGSAGLRAFHARVSSEATTPGI